LIYAGSSRPAGVDHQLISIGDIEMALEVFSETARMFALRLTEKGWLDRRRRLP
jgi:predicted transcriptional regulator of viral defense system